MKLSRIQGRLFKFLCDDPSFCDYLDGKARIAFKEDHTVFARNNFFDRINDVALIKVMAKCMVKHYDRKVSRMLSTVREPVRESTEECISDAQGPLDEEAQPEECYAIEETPAEECIPYDKDSPIEAQAEECYAIDETPAEDCPPPEPSTDQYPTQHYSISGFPGDEPPSQEASIEEPVTTAEHCVGSNFGASDAVPTELAPIAEDHPPEVNGWGFNFGSKATRNKWCTRAIIEESAPEPAPPVDDNWGCFASVGKKKKKTSKTCAKEEAEIAEPQPPPPEPEPEPLPEPAPAEGIKDNGWSSWGIPKKSKNDWSSNVATVSDPPNEDLPDEAPAPEPVPEEAQDVDWANCASNDVVKDTAPPPPPSPADSEPGPEPTMEKNEAGDWGSSSIFGGSRKKKKKSKSVWSKPTPVVDDLTIAQVPHATVIGNGDSDPIAEPEQSIEAEDEICPVRAKHLLGDEWQNCKQCRAILHQVAIQLVRAGHVGEEGYVVVDQMLTKYL